MQGFWVSNKETQNLLQKGGKYLRKAGKVNE
jgi:hypothetical protein